MDYYLIDNKYTFTNRSFDMFLLSSSYVSLKLPLQRIYVKLYYRYLTQC